MKYRVQIGASKTGSIGTKYCEKRTIEIEADSPDKVHGLAIAKVYEMGGLEHVRVEKVEPL